MKGEKWNVFSPGLVASNGLLHKQMLEVLLNTSRLKSNNIAM